MLIAAFVGFGTVQILFSTPVSATAATVTDATGISGTDAVASLVSGLSLTPWPAVTLIAQVVLFAASLFTLVTARRWASGASRKYRTAREAPPPRVARTTRSTRGTTSRAATTPR